MDRTGSVNRDYQERGELSAETMGRGFARLGTGMPDSLLQAGEFVRTLKSRQDLGIVCPGETACCQGWTTSPELERLGSAPAKGGYGQYFLRAAVEDAAAN